MLYVNQFTDEVSKQNIITNNSDKIILQIDETIDGNYIIFSDIKPADNQLSDLQKNQLTIMEAIADLYSALPTA